MAAVTAADVNLQLVGYQVAFIGIDFQISLRFSSECVVRLGSVFSVTDTADGETVESSRIEGSVLILEFSNGTVLEARPDDDYESWSYTGPEQTPTRIIAMPGGELAIWLPDDG